MFENNIIINKNFSIFEKIRNINKFILLKIKLKIEKFLFIIIIKINRYIN